MLISPIVTLQVSAMSDLVLAAIAAALVAGFRSFPIAFVAGMLMGIAQTEINRRLVIVQLYKALGGGWNLTDAQWTAANTQTGAQNPPGPPNPRTPGGLKH